MIGWNATVTAAIWPTATCNFRMSERKMLDLGMLDLESIDHG